MIHLFLCSVQWFSKQCLTITWIITGIKCPWISFHFRNILRYHCRASIFVLIYSPQAWSVVFVKFRQFLTANSSNDFHRSIKWVHIENVNTHFAHMCLLYPVALLKISPVCSKTFFIDNILRLRQLGILINSITSISHEMRDLMMVCTVVVL